MGKKKKSTRAQKAVSSAKRKTTTGKKNTSAKKKTAVADPKPIIPARYVWAVLCLAFFVLFLFSTIYSDGILLVAVKKILLGTIGKGGLYFAIPVLLYMFMILAFGDSKGLKMRCASMIIFVLTCGAIYHLSLNSVVLDEQMKVASVLYNSGIDGTSGGVICGMIAIGLRVICGGVMSLVLLSVIVCLTLLAAMKITVPSVIRAISNMPKDDWEDDELEDEPADPASLIVNHLANKHIEHKRQARQRKIDTMEAQQAYDNPPVQEEQNQVTESTSTHDRKINEMMQQIDCEIAEPVAAAVLPSGDEDISCVSDSELVEISLEESADTDVQVSDAEAMPVPVAQKMALPDTKKVTSKEAAASAVEVAMEVEEAKAKQKPVYLFPPINLLKRASKGGVDGTAEMRENSHRLDETLASFKIDAHIINVTRGPSVTRYEVELDKGVRLNKLTSCADDIALSLGASGVRIAAVPGRISVVGIEVPNKVVTNVSLREVIDSPEFNSSKSKSSFAVGKDIAGNCIVGNIAKMPHMLIAGTTGSGKSVCMNSIIISLLYKASPEDVKLIMVDPKMVELGIYNGIPHLLIPVVTDPKKAAGSLQWAVTEMMRRYKYMSDAGVRDLESYNSIIESQEVEGEKFPQVVVIIDELADLMLVAAKEVEDSICRIAQMGRAAGMHLIIATQRPSADVITGLMKANIPSRIAFAVASAMESRIILDTQGAEKLVGKGDMLYAPIGNGKPQRVQGCFVTDSEVEAVANYVKDHFVADYDQSVIEEIDKKAAQTGKKPSSSAAIEPNSQELDGDEMLPAAVDVIMETGQASVSMLQRRLKLGYARAARIVDEMEEKGIVGPFQGSKPRAILITKEKWEAMKSGGETQMEIDDLPFDDGVPEEID